jgi:hypothetical protein
VIRSFILGAITGGTVVWIWKDDIQRYMDDKLAEARHFVDDKTSTVRGRAADTLQSAVDGLQAAKDAIEGGLEGRGAVGGSPPP